MNAKLYEYHYTLYYYDQSGNLKGDQFLYRYEYDADNRIIDAYSSHNGMQWQNDAHYYYYLHSPLARVELVKYKVQGVDYGYTLVTPPALTPTFLSLIVESTLPK